MKQVSLFAGVGAFELAGQRNGVETVLSCELDKYAANVLRYRFPKSEVFNDDVRKLRGADVISRYGRIDIITAGFPCQSFSIAGKRAGFADSTRGTLFFEVARLADEIRPRYVILENVKGLFSHDKGRTFGIIISTLAELGYTVEWQLINSKDFGVPQNRERVLIVGHLGNGSVRPIFPVRKNAKISINKRTGIKTDKDIIGCLTAGYHKMPTDGQYLEIGTLRTYKDDKGFRAMKSSLCPAIPARAREDGGGQCVIKQDSRIRRLTEIECERLQGFPDGWNEKGIDKDGNETKTSGTQRYKQMGNSITVNVLEAIYERLQREV